MKKIIRIFFIALLLTSCYSKEVGFVYSPTNPRAGQIIRFTNMTDEGESWSWNFGDGTSSAVKSPSKTYKQAGEYVVTLKVDDKKSMMYSTTIIVLDTMPVITASDTVAEVFDLITFSVSYYNPNKYDLDCEWQFSNNVQLVEHTLVDSVVTVRFLQPDVEEKAEVRVTMNGKTDTISYTIYVKNVETQCLIVNRHDGQFGYHRVLGDYVSDIYWYDFTRKTNHIEAYDGAVYAFCDDGIFVINNQTIKPVLHSDEPIIAGTLLNDSIFWKGAGHIPHAAPISDNIVESEDNEMASWYQELADAVYMTNDGQQLYICATGITIGDNRMLSEYGQIRACAPDKVNGKVYFLSDDKLFVVNQNGDLESIAELAQCDGNSMIVDYESDRLYYVHSNKLMSLPLIHTERNVIIAEPTSYGNDDINQICVR